MVQVVVPYDLKVLLVGHKPDCWGNRNFFGHLLGLDYLTQLSSASWAPGFWKLCLHGLRADEGCLDVRSGSPVCSPWCSEHCLCLSSLADQKLFYYSSSVKITNVHYHSELSRQSSGRFRDLSERLERLVSVDPSAFPWLRTVCGYKIISASSMLSDHRASVP